MGEILQGWKSCCEPRDSGRLRFNVVSGGKETRRHVVIPICFNVTLSLLGAPKAGRERPIRTEPRASVGPRTGLVKTAGSEPEEVVLNPSAISGFQAAFTRLLTQGILECHLFEFLMFTCAMLLQHPDPNHGPHLVILMGSGGAGR